MAGSGSGPVEGGVVAVVSEVTSGGGDVGSGSGVGSGDGDGVGTVVGAEDSGSVVVVG